jgi:hypothetical protein
MHSPISGYRRYHRLMEAVRRWPENTSILVAVAVEGAGRRGSERPGPCSHAALRGLRHIKAIHAVAVSSN